MTGSGRNAGRTALLAGHALAENEAGDVYAADDGNPAFAVATAGASPGGLVPFSDEGIVSRKDWSGITGMPRLQTGQAYFVAMGGRLAKTGQQQIGVARSATDLRVGISALTPSVSQIHPVQGDPPSALGAVGDFAYDSNLSRWFGPKTSVGWGSPSHLIQPVNTRPLGNGEPVIGIPNTLGGWTVWGDQPGQYLYS